MGRAKPAETSSRKKKDPNAPKKAMSAYFLWMNANRDKVKKPGMGVTDIAKACGEQWRGMKDKTKWEKLAVQEKGRYEKEMTAYKKKGSTTTTDSPAAKKTAKAKPPKGKKGDASSGDDNNEEEMSEDSD